jgi:molybdate transport system substrate-binding protein
MQKNTYSGIAVFGLISALIVCIAISGCTSEQKEVTVYAGAGLKKPLDTIAQKYQAEKGVNVTLNYGASGALYTQIHEGQPADLFFSADWKFIDMLQNETKVGESEKFLRENVVLVTSKTGDELGIKTAQDLTKDDLVVVVADPSAPVGKYTENVLKKLNVWNATNDKGNIRARPSTVNQVALMVQNDEADAGFIFSSTAKLYDLEIREEYPQNLSGEIIFGLATIKGGNEELGKDFMNYIIQNKDEFLQYGWDPYA